MALAQPAREARKLPQAPPVYRPQPSRIQAKPAPSVTPLKKIVAPIKTAPRPNTAGARTIQRRSSNTIQREIVFAPGSRTSVVNVAESVGRMVDYGITRTVLNGRLFPGGGKANFISALLEPALRVERGHSSVAVSVESVPVQRVSFAMELPTRGDWEIDVNAANIKVKLQNLDKATGVGIPIEDSETSTLKLNVRGLPNDGTFADMVKTHEDVHVRDIQRAVDAVLKPWDARLTELRRLGTRFTGPTEMIAAGKLFEAVGGTPLAVGERFAEMLEELGVAFHATPAGKGPVIVNIARRGMLNRTLEVTLSHRAALVPLHQEAQRVERERAAYERAVEESLSRPVGPPINSGNAGNTFITNDML